MNISSNTLFHFTTKFSYLKSILQEGFWPRYCREYAWGGYDFAVPMTCFCDIPLSQIMDHTDTYGGYGIGMKKKWAMEHGITPVMYLANKSKLFNQTKYRIECIGNKQRKYSIGDFFLLHYIKKVAREKINENPFYEEREWRYIPKDYVFSSEYNPVFLKNEEEFKNDEYNRLTEKYKAEFNLDDISYIIIKTEADRKEMIKAINKIFSNSSDEERQLLISRILSLPQIKEDF